MGSGHFDCLADYFPFVGLEDAAGSCDESSPAQPPVTTKPDSIPPIDYEGLSNLYNQTNLELTLVMLNADHPDVYQEKSYSWRQGWEGGWYTKPMIRRGEIRMGTSRYYIRKFATEADIRDELALIEDELLQIRLR